MVKKAPGETRPLTVLIWIITGFGAYWFLPWFALEYGLFDATIEEYVASLGWKTRPPTLIVPVFLGLFIPFAWSQLPLRRLGWIYTLFGSAGICLIFFDFIHTGDAMGFSAAIVVSTLAAIFAIGIAKIGFQRGDSFISGAVVFVIFMVLVFIFYPVIKIFYQVLVSRDGSFAPFQFFRIITSFGVSRVVLNTLVLAISVGAATTFFGLIFALYAVRATTKLRYAIRVLYILPIITPPFVVGMSLILLFGRSGMVNDILMFLFGPTGIFTGAGSAGIFERSGYIYGFTGIFLAQTLSLTPISYMVLSGMISTINPSMEEASLTMRASRWLTLRNVTLPLIRPGIANAFLLGMISSAADFGNPLVLGGEYDVLSTEIYFSIAGAQLDLGKKQQYQS